ncbi:thiol-disulfide oxidoreductase DCC family protein [Methyloferula stellata]|uniref:thiol-disulfide oxidoreductase DCC family protein n=1 Tax=Methyloferula stellata TaxID=876270 RepID=UPI00037030F1|nr:DCC1-like thiol-disulfide oxidoreductase family protein [Methyloferula stellata]
MEAFAYRNDPAIPHFADDLPIVIFDGKCILCSSFVRFILCFDKHRRLRLLDGETPLGQMLFKHFGLDHVDYETIILLEDGRPQLKSDGSIRILEILGLPWSLAAIGRCLPQGPRDRLYEFIARNRYRWFGRRQSCYLPDPAMADRFIA